MTDKKELVIGVDNFFCGNYCVTDGRVVPDVKDIPLGKNGKEIESTMLFIDIRESTKIVDNLRRITAAKMYKSFLWGISKIARLNDGDIRSFNGDGILVVFIGNSKNTNATRAALQMSWFAQQILKPKLDNVFKNNQGITQQEIDFDFGIGIDTGKVLVVRGGISGDNNSDLVWVGNATNYAVKLSDLSEGNFHIHVSEDIYNNIHDSTKFGLDKFNMWEKRIWTSMNNLTVYRTSYYWPLP